MSRKIKVAAAQLGPVHLTSTRPETIHRMITLLESAASQNVRLLLFPELAFVTFFPRHLITDAAELDSFFEQHDDDGEDLTSSSSHARPLFERARELGVDISLGYAELVSGIGGRGEGGKEERRFNTCIYYSASEGRIISKYRKVHLPGTHEPFDSPGAINQLEKRYFRPGDLGFQAFRAPGLVTGAAKRKKKKKKVDDGAVQAEEKEEEDGERDGGKEDGNGRGDVILGMLICNDRRWPEAWRCLGLQGVEIVLCGYNTVAFAPDLVGLPPDDDTDPSLSGPTTTANDDENTTTNTTTTTTTTTATTATAEAAAEAEALFHHKLVMQANSYMNSCFSVSAAKCGLEDATHRLIGGSCITDPAGRVVVEAKGRGDTTLGPGAGAGAGEEGGKGEGGGKGGGGGGGETNPYGDELVVAELDLTQCRRGKEKVFDFARHRRVEHYGRIVRQTGVVEPELLVG